MTNNIQNPYKKETIHINEGVQGKSYERFKKLIKFKENEKIFDAGCANGILAKYLKDVVLIGGDLNTNKQNKISGYSKIFKCDIEKRIFLEESEVDTVVSISVFQYLENIDAAFKECMRVAKKRIIIWAPNSKLLRLRYLLNPSKINNLNYLDAKSLKNLGRKYKINTNIYYVSNKFNNLRKILKNYLSGSIIAIYNLKKEQTTTCSP